MKNYSENIENTLITFHTGRGGRFHNSGYKSFVDQDQSIEKYTEDLFIYYENQQEILKMIRKNSILLRHESIILDLMNDQNTEQLAEYGITEEMLGELIYFSAGGRSVGLSVKDSETGCGTIDIDREYDRTTVCLLRHCDEEEARLILESNNWRSQDVVNYLYEAFDLRAEYEPEEVEED